MQQPPDRKYRMAERQRHQEQELGRRCARLLRYAAPSGRGNLPRHFSCEQRAPAARCWPAESGIRLRLRGGTAPRAHAGAERIEQAA
jgi:hypothetical protein